MAGQHRRIKLHFTPTGSRWLNQVETWCSMLSRRAIRQGAFTSVQELVDAIQRFLEAEMTTAVLLSGSRPPRRS